MENEAWEEDETEVHAAKYEMFVEIGRVWNLDCVECDDMPKGIWESGS